MKRSISRILSTHVGSLIRPPQLAEAIQSRQGGKIDEAAYQQRLRDSVADVVKRQVEAGVDIINDGEFGKSTSWSLYILKRLNGFEMRPAKASAFARGVDREQFKDFYDELEGARSSKAWSNVTVQDAVCTGPISYSGHAEVQRDIENLKAAMQASKEQGFAADEAFLPVAAPSSAIPDRKNEFYKTDEELLIALAEALRTEYRAIADSGILLQVDDARAAVTYDRMVPPSSFDDYYQWLARHVEVLNHALEGIPSEKVRYHVCWGSWPGPHVSDVPLRKIVDLILKVNAGAYLIEAANPRHAHEWKVWKDVKLPEGKILVPGVVSHGTNVVEHPELVAERLLNFASCVGRENVIAGTDCGFAQEELNRRVHPSIRWAKLESMAEGARIASAELWGRKAQA